MCFAHGLHRHLHVGRPVERVEDAKDVDAVGRASLDELPDDVVGIVGVADGVTGAQQHLKQDVGNPVAQGRQPIPRILLQEAHRGVEGGAAPHLETEQIRQPVGHRAGRRQQIEGADARGQQRLMRIAHRRVGEQHTTLGAHPFRELFGAQREQFRSRARWNRAGGDVAERGRTRQAALRVVGVLDVGPSVDDDVAQIRQHLRGAVAQFGKPKELGRRVDERGRGFACEERRMLNQVQQKRDVGLDAADPELAQRAVRAADGFIEIRAPAW